ncbi:hypothetical protein RRG08_058815, partial [Elysia crispata]
ETKYKGIEKLESPAKRWYAQAQRGTGRSSTNVS